MNTREQWRKLFYAELAMLLVLLLLVIAIISVATIRYGYEPYRDIAFVIITGGLIGECARRLKWLHEDMHG